MAEETSKALPGKIVGKISDKLTDKLVEKVIEWVVALGFGGAIIAFVRSEWACISKPWCTVSGWSLGALIATAVAAIAAAIYVGRGWYRTRQMLHVAKAELSQAQESIALKQSKVTTAARLPVRVPFEKITVEDNRLKLRWFIRRPPHEWLYLRDVATRVSPAAVQEILDGPFHAVPGCNAALREIAAPASAGYDRHSPVFEDHCPTCGLIIFRAAVQPGFAFEKWVDVWPVRAQALEELQRMERNDSKVFENAPVVLERPRYWSLMLSPR